jgi:hypothetical protein
VFTTVLANRLAKTIPAKVPPAVIAAGLPESSVAAFIAAVQAGSQTAFDAVAGLTPEIRALGTRAYQEANSAAFNTVFLVTIAFSGIGIICTFFSPNVDHLLTREVNITVSGSKETKTAMGTYGGGSRGADVEQLSI